MDKISKEEDKKNQNIFVTVLLITLCLGGIILGIFTNYKKEILMCSLEQDVCYVEKINYANLKTKKNLLKYSNISDVQILPQKVKGNRYAKGYKLYLLVFRDEKYNPVQIFKNAYLDKNQAENIVKNLDNKIKNNEKFIKLEK